MNFFQNIFGSLWGRKLPYPTNVDFIPNGYNGNATTGQDILFVKGGEPSWLGLGTPDMQYWSYVFCSPLAAVIDELAEADINGEVEIIKDNKSEDYSNSASAKKLKALLKKPNPLQTWEQFRGQQIVFKKVFGYCPVYPMIPSGFESIDASYLWNLNPYYAKPIKNEKFKLNNGENSIERWDITIYGQTYELPADSIFIIKDGYLDTNRNDLFLPLSKVEGLEWAISNICAAMEADNVLLRKKGPLGFISHDPKPDNVAGYVPMTSKEKTEIQQNLDTYGLTWSQFQYVVSRLPVRWNPMSFNVKDLMTKETTRQAIDMICDRYNYPAELMSGKNATYENRNSAEKFLYQNNVVPSSLRDMRVYNDFFKLEEYRIKLCVDYDHLPVLQEDIVKQAQAISSKAGGYLVLYQNSVITLNQYRTAMFFDTVEGDDVYFAEAQKKYGVKEEPPLKVVPAQKEKVA